MKIKLAISLALISLLLFAGIRFVQLTFSEGLDITPGTVNSFVLIPEQLKSSDISRLGAVSTYYYSAADGPKPVVYVANIATIKGRDTLDEEIKRYFQGEGFTACDQGLLCRDSMAMNYSLERGVGGKSTLKIELLDFLQ